MATCCLPSGALARLSSRHAGHVSGPGEMPTLVTPGWALHVSGQTVRTAVRANANPVRIEPTGEGTVFHEGPLYSRRDLAITTLVAGVVLASGVVHDEPAAAVSTSRRALRGEQVPESEYKTLPNGLKYYDLKVGGGAQAVKGSRVAVHYVVKWKGLTFMTSRQGMGVTGGTPYGFDVGSSEQGIVLKGLDEGVLGMKVGGQRLLIVPPELAYGNKQVQELPPNSTLQFDVELLSIKENAFGSFVKVVEG